MIDKDLTEQQFFSCKAGHNIYQLFANKAGGSIKSLGLKCDGYAGGQWNVLSSNVSPSTFHSSWIGGQLITSITIYKWLDPNLGYFVVSAINACTLNTVTQVASCHGFTPTPACKTAGSTCQVTTYTAPDGQTLNNFYFKTVINSAATIAAPGNILEFKASTQPITPANVNSI